MTRDDIIRMAREAGATEWCPGWHLLTKELEHFAAIVAAAEREACAEILDRNADACASNSMLRDVLIGNALAIRARGSHGQA